MNFILNYISCLEAFAKKNPACTRQANELVRKLKTLTSFAELRLEIENAIQTGDRGELFTKNPFINQLKRWKIDLENLDSACQNAIQIMNNDTGNDEKLFTNFINQLLNDERCKFHVYGLSFIKQLERTDNVINIIQHLKNLPEVPAPESPMQGSFEAITPENEAHERCLALLRKNSKYYDASNTLFIKTNTLLQNALSIYGDIYQPDFFPNPKGFCNII